jgi:glycerol-3-phosphate dehydrogenase (NAD(P)+)
MKKKIGIIGAGAWGTTIAILTCKNGHSVSLWHYNSKKALVMQETRNCPYLLNAKINDNIIITDKFNDILDSDILIYAAPAQEFNYLTIKIAEYNPIFNNPIIIASKGIDNKINKLLDSICKDNLPNSSPVILSGPGFAEDIVRELPTALTIAAHDLKLANMVGSIFANEYFRPYFSKDLIGVQVGGALKNVIAIASGITIGNKLGDGAVASIITRGLSEMTKFGIALGAKQETFNGLSGVGDLVLTATNKKSRNTKLGILIGSSESITDYSLLSEGVHTTNAVMHISKYLDVRMPITEAVHQIINNKYTAKEAISSLLKRPLRDEL